MPCARSTGIAGIVARRFLGWDSPSPGSCHGRAVAVRDSILSAGAWRRLVARLLWEQDAGCSNHLAPTNIFQGDRPFSACPLSLLENRVGEHLGQPYGITMEFWITFGQDAARKMGRLRVSLMGQTMKTADTSILRKKKGTPSGMPNKQSIRWPDYSSRGNRAMVRRFSSPSKW